MSTRPLSVPPCRSRYVACLIPGLGLLALAGCGEDPQSPPDAVAVPGPALAAATALGFLQVSAGEEHSCGITTDNLAYCWGLNSLGQLGDGTTTDRLKPVRVSGSLRFRQISAGFFATCGVTTDSRAYCWGDNAAGELGDGTKTERHVPVAVAGGHLFHQVQTRLEHACAQTSTGNLVYCWGQNDNGQLGDGTTNDRLKPVAVVGGHLFSQVAVGYNHSCGVTTDQRVFCWGLNRVGQLGDSTTAWLRLRPRQVAGTHRFRQLDASRDHTCAVTTEFRAFCWGEGSSGELGTGKVGRSRYPQAVAGGFSFRVVSAGAFHVCALTTANRAYCWGSNGNFELGDGTQVNHSSPVPVTGGLFFAQIGAGGFHTCARTSGNVAYCWGRGLKGQLGDGSSVSRGTPAPVAGTP